MQKRSNTLASLAGIYQVIIGDTSPQLITRDFLYVHKISIEHARSFLMTFVGHVEVRFGFEK